MPFLVSTLYNADPHFAVVITASSYQQIQHHVEVADQDPANKQVVYLQSPYIKIFSMLCSRLSRLHVT